MEWGLDGMGWDGMGIEVHAERMWSGLVWSGQVGSCDSRIVRVWDWRVGCRTLEVGERIAGRRRWGGDEEWMMADRGRRIAAVGEMWRYHSSVYEDTKKIIHARLGDSARKRTSRAPNQPLLSVPAL